MRTSRSKCTVWPFRHRSPLLRTSGFKAVQKTQDAVWLIFFPTENFPAEWRSQPCQVMLIGRGNYIPPPLAIWSQKSFPVKVSRTKESWASIPGERGEHRIIHVARGCCYWLCNPCSWQDNFKAGCSQPCPLGFRISLVVEISQTLRKLSSITALCTAINTYYCVRGERSRASWRQWRYTWSHRETGQSRVDMGRVTTPKVLCRQREGYCWVRKCHLENTLVILFM